MGLLAREPDQLPLPLVLRQRLEVAERQGQGSGSRHALHRLAVRLAEGRAQDVVSPNHLAQAPLEHGAIERTLQPDGSGDVVERQPRSQLLEEPEPLLSEGEGCRSAAERDAALDRREAALPQQLRDELALARGEIDGLRQRVSAHAAPFSDLPPRSSLNVSSSERLPTPWPVRAISRTSPGIVSRATRTRARPAIVGASKRPSTPTLHWKTSASRLTIWVATSECPPRSKKLSFTPISSKPRYSRQASAIVRSTSSRGGTWAVVKAGRR